jgi:hypothetical protein
VPLYTGQAGAGLAGVNRSFGQQLFSMSAKPCWRQLTIVNYFLANTLEGFVAKFWVK